MSMKQTIIDAINAMMVIEINYKNELRVVEPHLLGINQKGNLCLSAFQLSGGSGQSWRAYLVADIRDCWITGNRFAAPRNGYNSNDSTMQSILARL